MKTRFHVGPLFLIFSAQENALQDPDCPIPNNGHKRKCHMYQKEVLPYENPCCECTHGTVFNGTSCVDESRCPCEENGNIRLPDEEWKDPDDECKIKSKFCIDYIIATFRNLKRRKNLLLND